MHQQNALDITVRVGCNCVYEAEVPTPILLTLKPRSDGRQMIREERLSFGMSLPPHEYEDQNENITYRTVLSPGRNEVRHDALVSVSSLPDNYMMYDEPIPVEELPPQLMRYTLPSRYCDSDKLFDFAWGLFGQVPHGIPRIIAICNWLHFNVEYRFGSGRPDLSASEVLARRYGVCRDFAHAGIALCRAFNLPARYVTGHLPDIGFTDPGTPMDFHAYFEVFLGQHWSTFDARFNTPRIGRVKVAQGLDAVDGAFSTIYGQVQFKWFEVWAYQVNPAQVSVGDPVDMSKRLDGTVAVRRN